MGTLAATNPTLLDVAKRTDPNGQISSIAEILNLTNPVLDDMSYVEGNLPTGHKSTARTGLPAVSFRKLYGGVLPDKSLTSQITDSCGMLEAYAEVDKALADLSGDPAAFRLSEDKAWIEAMSQKAASSIFYANEALVPEGFTGLTPRFDAATGAENSDNMFSAYNTNASTCTSIWLVGWSPETVFGIYPKGSKAGLTVTDKGQVTVENAGNDTNFTGRMEAYRTHYRWDLGLVVRDWRYVSRLHSIEVGSVKGDYSSGPNLINAMIAMSERIPNLSNCRPVFYMNRKMMTFLRFQKLKAAAYNLTDETVEGKMVTMFNGIPIRRTDAILSTETGKAVAADF
jgi:hypothetical protein